MRDTYKPSFWSVDYVSVQDENIDPMDSDAAMDEYIERRRREFYVEWNKYLAEVYE